VLSGASADASAGRRNGPLRWRWNKRPCWRMATILKGSRGVVGVGVDIRDWQVRHLPLGAMMVRGRGILQMRTMTKTTRTTMTRGILVGMRIRVVHPGALIQVADRTRALARRRQHRYRDNNRLPTRTRIRDTLYHRTITTIYRSSSLQLTPRRLSCPCGPPRTSHLARPRPSLHRHRHLRPSGRAHRLLHPCRPALRRRWLPPLLYLRLRLRVSLHQQHRKRVGVRGCRRSVSSAHPLLDFRVQGLVVDHVTGSEIWVHFWRIGVMLESLKWHVPVFNIRRYPGTSSCMIYDLFLLVGACTMMKPVARSDRTTAAINTTIYNYDL
jgi:hypothetical protein